MDMAEIYSKTFWNLFDDLDSSLDPAGPDQLYEIADAYLHVASGFWMWAAATHVT